MKTSGWVATAVGAVVVVGGGIWAATTLPADDETAYTGAYEPAITETPAASAEPVETAAVEPEETIEPAPEETVTPEYSEAEQVFLPWARSFYEPYRADAPALPEMTDQDMLDALYKACELVDEYPIVSSVIPGFATMSDLNPDNAEDDANRLFFDAARDGNGSGMSYCG